MAKTKKKAGTAKGKTASKAVPKAASVKKTAAKKSGPKKAVVKKAAAKKPAPSKKSVPKKAAAKKPAPAKKSVPKKTAAKEVTRDVPKRSTVQQRAAERAKAASRARTGEGGGRSKIKMLPKDFLLELSQTIRNAVEPAIRASKGRDIAGLSASGDVSFDLDKIAEKALFSFLKSGKMPVAYYSEDTGYTTFSNSQPQHLLIVDPIDGTRAAKVGFEACVVSVGSTRVIERPVMADIESACLMEILGKRTFYAERGKGARIYDDGHTRRVKLSQNTDLELVSWAMTVPARPADLIFPTASKLIDLTSLKGGFFACNSTAFSLSRLITNQLDACVDFANRYYRDLGKIVEDQFINAGRGAVLGICPYDFAAALLIVKEAGCIVTDAYGNTFDDVLLLDSGVANQRSLIAAGNAALHEKLLKFFDTRISQFGSLLKRRAEKS